MDINEAKEICKDMGWEITEGKYFLHNPETPDRVSFNSDEELIAYAEELKANG